MITAAPSLTSNIANTSTGKLTDTPLAPPRGYVDPPRQGTQIFAPTVLPNFNRPKPVVPQTFAPTVLPQTPIAQTFPIVTPRGTFVPILPSRPSTPTVNSVFVNTDIVSIPRPTFNDNVSPTTVVPQIVGSLPPRGINTGNIPIQTMQLLNPKAAVLANTPIPTNIKVASFSTTVVDDLGKPIENANVYLDNVAIGLTDKNGFVTKSGYNPLAVLKISFVGFQPYEGLASQVPSKVVLTTGLQLEPLVITNDKPKKGFPWLYAILIGGGLYVGYKAMNKSGSIKASI